jgi:hypothetical protein
MEEPKMASEAPQFFVPNNMSNQSSGGAAPQSSQDPGKDPAQSGPRPNTVTESVSGVPGSSPMKPSPNFMK